MINHALWSQNENRSILSLLNGEGNGTPLQYSCLENPMDRGAWWAAVHEVAKSQTQLSDFTFIFTFMHWRRKWQPTPVFLPGESQGRGSLVGCCLWHRVGHDWSDLAPAAMEKEMATHSSILAWRIPWTEELGGLQSLGSQRVRHDWVTQHTSLLNKQRS